MPRTGSLIVVILLLSSLPVKAAGHPVLFVHGWCSDSGGWNTMFENLPPERYGEELVRYHQAADGSVRARESARSPRARSFAIDFYDRGRRSFAPRAVADIPIQAKAGQLKAVVDEIKRSTGHAKVTVISHGMGGLVARAYIQGWGLDASGRPVAYADDVAGLITINTPHRGSLLAGAANDLTAADPPCQHAATVNRSEMAPGSTLLDIINRRPWPAATALHAIVSYDLAPGRPDTDGLVTRESQDIRTISDSWARGPGVHAHLQRFLPAAAPGSTETLHSAVLRSPVTSSRVQSIVDEIDRSVDESSPAQPPTADPPRTPSPPARQTSPDGAAIVRIDAGVTHQVMGGFGSSVRVFDDPHVFENFNPGTGRAATVLTQAQQDEVLDRLYLELKLTRVRTTAAGDRPPGIEPANDNDDPHTLDPSRLNFDWKRVDAHCEYISAVKPRGVTTYFHSPVFREPWMGVITATDAAEYAEWLFAHIRRCRDLGVEMPYASIVNEPSHTRNRMSGEFIRNVVRALGPMLRRAGFDTMFVVSDDVRSSDAERTLAAVLGDPVARSYIGALAFHLYDEPVANAAALTRLSQRYGVPLWMTEFMVGSMGTAGLHSDPFGWANLMHDLIVEYGVSAIDYMWGFFGQWVGDGDTLVKLRHETAGGQRYLGYELTKTYYYVGQFSRFIQQGDRRILSGSPDGSLKVAAFSDGSDVTIVAINNGSSPASVDFSLAGLPAGLRLQVVRTSATENWAALPPVSASGGRIATTLAGGSVTTFTTRESGTPLPEPARFR